MKRSKMKSRIEELERRVQELEARPLPLLPPITVPAAAPLGGWWGIYPPTGLTYPADVLPRLDTTGTVSPAGPVVSTIIDGRNINAPWSYTGSVQ